LLLRNAYLVTENRILRHQITGRVRLTDGERKTLAEIGQKLGKQALEDVAKIVKPDTILAWHRKLKPCIMRSISAAPPTPLGSSSTYPWSGTTATVSDRTRRACRKIRASARPSPGRLAPMAISS